MMARKKDERRKRKRKDVDIINDNDDLIAHLIQQMKVASEVTLSTIYILSSNWLYFRSVAG